MNFVSLDSLELLKARTLDLKEAFESGDVRSPLSGLFPSTLPQKTIEEALLPLESAGILINVRDTIDTAIMHIEQNMEGVFPLLSDDQKISIVVFSMEQADKSVYRNLFLLAFNQIFSILAL